MESAPSTCFLGRGLVGGGLNSTQVAVRFPYSSSQRWYPASCKMRQRIFSVQNKRQQAKRVSIPKNKNFKPSDGSNSDSSKLRKDGISPTNTDFEPNADGNFDSSNLATDRNSPENTNSEPNGDGNSDPNSLRSNSKTDSDQEMDSSNNIPIIIESEYSKGEGYINSSPHNEVMSLHRDTVDSAEGSVYSNDENMSSSFPSNDIPPATGKGELQHSGIHLQDLIGMIRIAEKNIRLLNESRERALHDLQKILSEKETLQGEMNILEMKLAETDARMNVATQEKVNAELLEGQLEKMRNELSSRDGSEEYLQDMNYSVSSSQVDVSSFSQELDSLRAENISLKDELQVLKAELSTIRETDRRVQALKEERSLLESSFKELESKLAASHEDVSEISSLKFECKNLFEKVEDLQKLLDKATEQADKAILALQQNEELRKKVDHLEESLGEASEHRLSSEKMQQHTQQKIEILQNNNAEIRSYFKLCQDSVKEFQDTLDTWKEESKKRAEDESVHDKPFEFWSTLLLMVDGWFLEKKISVAQLELLREMIWNKDKSICDSYLSMQGKSEREIISTFLKLTSSTTGERLHIIHIAAEMAPVAKVGGLGDVVTGLSKALQKKGHLVEVVLPKYDCMQYDLIPDLKVLDFPVESYFDGRLYKNKIWVGTVEGLPVYFIEPLHPSKFFWRNQFYGEHDDFQRFSYFSRAALELVHQAGKKPDIIHSHDWQTAFVAPLYWDLYVPKGLNSARICFTCHNFEYQGAAPASALASCGLDVHRLNRPDRMQDHSADKVNPVKGAVVFSNIVTTVSPTYAQEVRTSKGGKGLHETLNSHSKKFVGILNGIDTDAWNPATDSFLKVQYHSNDIDGKAENKEALRKQLLLSSAIVRQPLVACVTRLVPQKGVHLIKHAIYRTLELGGQFVLLGSSPVPQIQKEFEGICNQFKTHEQVRLVLKYDESLSHLIYAAADMLVIPSIFEPCGLTQMIAMRYGTIPIVRKTGGLNDSVFDLDDDIIPAEFRNGFSFLTADEKAFDNALERAFDRYNTDPNGWKELVQKVMSIDFSWESSAPLYEELYQKSVARARGMSR